MTQPLTTNDRANAESVGSAVDNIAVDRETHWWGDWGLNPEPTDYESSFGCAAECRAVLRRR